MILNFTLTAWLDLFRVELLVHDHLEFDGLQGPLMVAAPSDGTVAPGTATPENYSGHVLAL